MVPLAEAFPLLPRTAAAAAAAVVVRPGLWPTALRQIVLLAPRRWWRRWPPLPIPDAGWLRFRLVTAYGDDGGQPPAGDVVDWLRWCRRQRALSR